MCFICRSRRTDENHNFEFVNSGLLFCIGDRLHNYMTSLPEG